MKLILQVVQEIIEMGQNIWNMSKVKIMSLSFISLFNFKKK